MKPKRHTSPPLLDIAGHLGQSVASVVVALPLVFLQTGLARGTAAMLLVLAGLLGVSQPTSAANGKLVNLSARALVETGEEVMIGGFIIEEGARQVLIQARGPELVNDGISNVLADPILTVIQISEGEPPRTVIDPPIEIMVNDNWEDSQGQLISDLWGGSPNLTAGSLSSAAVVTLGPGQYTTKIEGKNGSEGVAIVEVYAIDSAGPDLSVQSFYASPASPLVGESFILVGRVRNRGDQEAAATTLRYYRSTDATITTSDTEVGTGSLAGLGASAHGDVLLPLTAPSDAGTYYYGACVDAVSGETDTTNNCSSAEAVSVTETRPEPEVRPDLALESAYVAPSGKLDSRQSFIFGVTVRNQGDGESLTSPTLRYYMSLDATITADDRQVGTDSVGPLAVSGKADETITLTAPSTPGTYYYGACVGTVPGETSTSNNCSAAVQVVVEGAPLSGGPDLSVQSFYASPASPLVGESFILVGRVRNRGDQEAAATTLRYYRSTDATITTSDTEVGTGSLAGLGASAHGDVLLPLTAPSDAGTYYYGACVDAVSGETDTTNNCSSAEAVSVTETRPEP